MGWGSWSQRLEARLRTPSRSRNKASRKNSEDDDSAIVRKPVRTKGNVKWAPSVPERSQNRRAIGRAIGTFQGEADPQASTVEEMEEDAVDDMNKALRRIGSTSTIADSIHGDADSALETLKVPGQDDSLQGSNASSDASSSRSGTSGEGWRKIEQIANDRVTLGITDITIGDLIGQGSYGKVFRAQMKTSTWKMFPDREVAVKQVFDVELMENEAIVLSVLNHRNIVRYIGECVVDLSNGVTSRLLVTEFANEGTLQKYIEDHGTNDMGLDLIEVVHFWRQLSSGMAYLHDRGLVHRDLKPPNLLLTDAESEDGRLTLKIADLGTCRPKMVNDTKMASLVGTLSYCAPEVIRSEEYDNKCDVWSAAVSAWSMYTGKLPFEGMHPVSVAFAVGSGKLELPIPDSMSPLLAEPLRACLRPSAIDRPTFADLLQSLPVNVKPESRERRKNTNRQLTEELQELKRTRSMSGYQGDESCNSTLRSSMTDATLQAPSTMTRQIIEAARSNGSNGSNSSGSMVQSGASSMSAQDQVQLSEIERMKRDLEAREQALKRNMEQREKELARREQLMVTMERQVGGVSPTKKKKAAGTIRQQTTSLVLDDTRSHTWKY